MNERTFHDLKAGFMCGISETGISRSVASTFNGAAQRCRSRGTPKFGRELTDGQLRAVPSFPLVWMGSNVNLTPDIYAASRQARGSLGRVLRRVRHRTNSPVAFHNSSRTKQENSLLPRKRIVKASLLDEYHLANLRAFDDAAITRGLCRPTSISP